MLAFSKVAAFTSLLWQRANHPFLYLRIRLSFTSDVCCMLGCFCTGRILDAILRYVQNCSGGVCGLNSYPRRMKKNQVNKKQSKKQRKKQILESIYKLVYRSRFISIYNQSSVLPIFSGLVWFCVFSNRCAYDRSMSGAGCESNW